MIYIYVRTTITEKLPTISNPEGDINVSYVITKDHLTDREGVWKWTYAII